MNQDLNERKTFCETVAWKVIDLPIALSKIIRKSAHAFKMALEKSWFCNKI